MLKIIIQFVILFLQYQPGKRRTGESRNNIYMYKIYKNGHNNIYIYSCLSLFENFMLTFSYSSLMNIFFMHNVLIFLSFDFFKQWFKSTLGFINYLVHFKKFNTLKIKLNCFYKILTEN